MADTAKRTNPELWEKVKSEVTRGDKGGQPDQWSARKAQLAVSEYKKRGGSYQGKKSQDNHLTQWTEEDWGTRSGKPSGETHERYLPKAARESLTKSEYDRTTATKKTDSAKGRQFSRQPKDVAEKVAPTRSPYQGADTKPSKSALMTEAKKRGLTGRSRMSKAELSKALHACRAP